MFVDSDDFLDRWAVTKAMANISNHEMLAFGCTEFYEDNHFNQLNFSHKHEVNYESYWEEYFTDQHSFIYIVVWNKLFRRSIFDQLQFKKNKINEDAFIIEKIIQNCTKIVLLNQLLYFYRRRSESITSTELSGHNYDAVQARLSRVHAFLKRDKKDLAYQTLLEAKSLLEKIHDEIKDKTSKFYENRYLRLKSLMQHLFLLTYSDK